MKILVVSNGFPPRGSWGTEFYTRELVLGLIRRGHEVSVLHPVRSGEKPRYSLEEVDEGGVRVHLLQNQGDPRKRFAASYRDTRVDAVFETLLRRLRPDVVHFTYLLWGLSLGLPGVARALGIPSLVTLTDYGLVCHRGQMFDHTLVRCFGPHPPEVCARCIREPAPYDLVPKKLARRRLFVRAAAALGGLGRVATTRELERREALVRELFGTVPLWIAPTASLAQVFQGAGLPRERILELCYSFDETPYRLAAAAGAPRGPPRIGFVGQLAPHKGLGTLVEAARGLARARPTAAWELVLHGAPSEGRHRHYATFVLRPPSERIRLAPAFPPEAAPTILAGLTALALPSEWDENAPLALLQALAVGLPVLASNVPGIAELARERASVRLVRPGDVGAWERALAAVVRGELARDPAPGLALGLDEHLTRIEGCYERLSEPARG